MSLDPYQTPETVPVANTIQSVGRFGKQRSTSAVAWVSIALLSFSAGLLLLSLCGIYVGFGNFERLISIVLGLGVVISICMWTSKSMINAWAAGDLTPTITPGWAAGWYFIPIAFLWKPYEAMREIWINLFGNNASRGLLLSWWIFWILNILTKSVTSVILKDGITSENYELYYSVSMVWVILRILAAILLIIVILKVTRGQQDRMNQQNY